MANSTDWYEAGKNMVYAPIHYIGLKKAERQSESAAIRCTVYSIHEVNLTLTNPSPILTGS